MVGVESEQHRIRLERMQGGGRIGQFLQILAVVALVGLHPQAAPEGADADSGKQVGQRRGAKHRKPDRSGPQTGRGRGAEMPLQEAIHGAGADEVETRVGQRHQFVPDESGIGSGVQRPHPGRDIGCVR